MRNRFHDEPVGHPFRGAPYGERTDPSTIAPAMQGAGTALNFIGNMNAGDAARRQGQAQNAAAQFEAAQLDQAAGQSVAAAQRKALDEKRRTALVVSRGLAVAAASGGGASDPTVQNLLADVEGQGAYRAGVALYEGEERARQINLGASAKRYEGSVMEQGGRDRQRAYEMAGFGGLATGGATLFKKYGKGGPKNPGGTAAGGDWLDGAGGDSGNDLYG